MAKGRMIDKVIVLSRKINKISEGAENLYYRIYVNTDDYGHYHADPNIIKGQIYTLRNISLDEIQARISELAKIVLIKLYNHNGEEYLEIVDFDKHQKFRKDVALQAIYPKPVTFTKRDVTDTGQHEPKRLPKLSKVKLREDKLIKDMQPQKAAPALLFPLKDGTDYPLELAKISEYEKTYHNIDVQFELKKCLQWDIDNPGKRKTKRGIMKHINQWLSNASKDKRPPIQAGIDPDNTAVEEARKEIAKITPEQYAKNKAKIAELARGATKKT